MTVAPVPPPAPQLGAIPPLASAEGASAAAAKVGFGEKLSYFALNVGNIPVMMTLSAFLLIFYTDVVGLDPVAVGTLFLIARVLDGVSDPIMGYIVDHLPPTRFGRFRGYLMLGAILCSINFALVFLGPDLVPAGKLAVAYVSYLLIGWLFDLMDIPNNALLPVITANENERTKLSMVKGLAYIVGGVIVMGSMLPIVGLFPTKREGFTVAIIGIAIFIAVLSVVGTLGIKERVQPVEGAEKYRFRDLVRIIGARPVLALFGTTLLQQIAAGATTGIGVFFFLYVLKRPDLFSIGALSIIVGVILAIPLTTFLVRRYGKKVVLALSMVISIVGSVVSLFLPASQGELFLIVGFLTAPAIGLSMLIGYAIQADNMDYIEWKLGYRAEAAVASANSFIVKAAAGVGSAIGAYALAWIGYVANAPEQTPGTIQGLYVINFAVPAALNAAALLVWWFGYPLGKKAVAQMQSELAARRAEHGMEELPVEA